MQVLIPFNKHLREIILQTTETRVNFCYTCNACIAECPMNISATVLNPLKLVRMANFGIMDELIRLQELWYCLQCRRCYQVCPMMVNNAALVRFLRNEAFLRKIVSRTFEFQHRLLQKRLHRMRFHMVSFCREGKAPSKFLKNLEYLGNLAPPRLDQVIFFKGSGAMDGFRKAIDTDSKNSNNISLCLACRGCSGVCPVCYEGDIFDPLRLFRMAALEQKADLLRSPWIWLCIGCENCTETCLQGVKGHRIIRNLQETAIQEGYIPKDFRYRLQDFTNVLYPSYIREVDKSLNRTVWGMPGHWQDKNFYAQPFASLKS